MDKSIKINTVKEEFVPHKIMRYMKVSEIAAYLNSFLQEIFVDFAGVELRNIKCRTIKSGNVVYSPTLGFDMILRQKVSDEELDDTHNIKLKKSMRFEENNIKTDGSIEQMSEANFRQAIMRSNSQIVTDRYQLTDLGKDLIRSVLGDHQKIETISNDFVGDVSASSSIVKIIDIPVEVIFRKIFKIEGWDQIRFKFTPSGTSIPTTMYNGSETIYLVEATSVNMVEDVARVRGLNRDTRVSSNPNTYYV